MLRAEYAAVRTRQFGLVIMVPNGPRPLLVASGPDAEDYHWTEVMMREVGADVDALALHYYTIPDRKGAFGSGTDFDEATYARTFSKTLFMGSEEHTSELQSLMRISYAVFCLKKKKIT